jgi:hypothetical protein
VGEKMLKTNFLKSKNAKKVISLIILCMMLNFFAFSFYLAQDINLYAYNDNSEKENKNLNDQGVVFDEYTKEWIKNGGFDTTVDPFFCIFIKNYSLII